MIVSINYLEIYITVGFLLNNNLPTVGYTLKYLKKYVLQKNN